MTGSMCNTSLTIWYSKETAGEEDLHLAVLRLRQHLPLRLTIRTVDQHRTSLHKVTS
jgi:hypothetical protein